MQIHAQQAPSEINVRPAGFTLIEVLIAMAITAIVGVIAYSAIAQVTSGAEGLRANADRSYEVNRALMIMSRDLRHFVARPIRDEYGESEPAMAGGELARFKLSFTRAGWHNPQGYPRSNLQRVNYRVEDEALWRDSYVVLDRAGNTEPRSTLLLDNVEYMDLSFIGAVEALQIDSEGESIDKSNWPENWVPSNDAAADRLAPPIALEVRLQLTDWGEVKRLYDLPNNKPPQ